MRTFSFIHSFLLYSLFIIHSFLPMTGPGQCEKTIMSRTWSFPHRTCDPVGMIYIYVYNICIYTHTPIHIYRSYIEVIGFIRKGWAKGCGAKREREAAIAPGNSVTGKAPQDQRPTFVPGMTATVAAAELRFHWCSNSQKARWGQTQQPQCCG